MLVTTFFSSTVISLPILQASFSVAHQPRRYRLRLAICRESSLRSLAFYVIAYMCHCVGVCVLLVIVIAVLRFLVVDLTNGQRRLSLPTGSVVYLCPRAASSVFADGQRRLRLHR